MAIAEDLKASLKEAIDIKKGHKNESRVTRYEIADVRAIREVLNVSQAEFAQGLGTSLDTVKSWEGRRRNPTGLAAKVLASIKDDPKIFKQLASH